MFGYKKTIEKTIEQNRIDDTKRYNELKTLIKRIISLNKEKNSNQRITELELKLLERCRLDGHVNTVYSLDGKPTVGEHDGTEIVKCRYCGFEEKDNA